MELKKYALVCLPSNTVDRGLRMEELGKVDIARARKQHRTYCQALKSLGYTLIALPPDDRYPDSVFVEDPAVIIGKTLIRTRLRCKERQGEEALLEKTLAPMFSDVHCIEEPGFVEGGDVLVTHDRLYVGLSKRTNAEGVEQLARIAKDRGYSTIGFKIPEDALHLKGGVTYHSNLGPNRKNTITVSEELASYFDDSGCRLVVIPKEERFGANCITGGSTAFIHAGRPKTKRTLQELGLEVFELPMSEFEKIDGAITCLSKLFLK